MSNLSTTFPPVTYKDFLIEVIGIAVDINNTGKATVFAEYNAHTSTMDVRIFKRGWSENTYPDVNMSTRLNDDEDSAYYLKKQFIIDELKKFQQTL